MRCFLYILAFFISLGGFAISNEEATKMVDKYDTLQKKILGFINCVSTALTGDEAITPMEPTKEIVQHAKGLGGCFEIVGFKMGNGFSKMTSIFSKGNEGTASQPVAPLHPLQPELPPQDLIKTRVPASEPASPKAVVPPFQKVEKPTEKAPPAAKAKIKTAW